MVEEQFSGYPKSTQSACAQLLMGMVEPITDTHAVLMSAMRQLRPLPTQISVQGEDSSISDTFIC